MSRETLIIASDHGGVELKALLKQDIESLGFDVLDLGSEGPGSVDYPDYGYKAAEALAAGKARRGVIICGSGIGISIAANRHPIARAALCHDALTARLARQHNDANLLALGARTTGVETAKDCLRVFLSTDFEGGRHVNRVAKLGQPPKF